MIVNPTPITVDENLHKIDLDVLRYSEQSVNSFCNVQPWLTAT